MSEKKIQKVYDALIDGAFEGLSDKALHDYVVERCPKATSKRIVRASLLALTDPDVKDPAVLNVIYALAIKHRLDGGPEREDPEEDDGDGLPVAPKRKKGTPKNIG